jgi:hypothetical protein
MTAEIALLSPHSPRTPPPRSRMHTGASVIKVKKGDQLGRMKEVCIFNPLHIIDLCNKISVSDIDGLKIFKLYEHPVIQPQIEVMKTEVMQYQTLVGSIKSFEERKDINRKDTFDLSDWWRSNCATLPGFTYVLRAVLNNSPNSCPPESLFIIFNTTYDDDQKSSYTDYIQLSIQSQFNKRGL